mgnify:CR=1 FL=1
MNGRNTGDLNGCEHVRKFRYIIVDLVTNCYVMNRKLEPTLDDRECASVNKSCSWLETHSGTVKN